MYYTCIYTLLQWYELHIQYTQKTCITLHMYHTCNTHVSHLLVEVGDPCCNLKSTIIEQRTCVMLLKCLISLPGTRWYLVHSMWNLWLFWAFAIIGNVPETIWCQATNSNISATWHKFVSHKILTDLFIIHFCWYVFKASYVTYFGVQ